MDEPYTIEASQPVAVANFIQKAAGSPGLLPRAAVMLSAPRHCPHLLDEVRWLALQACYLDDDKYYILVTSTTTVLCFIFVWEIGISVDTY